MKIIYEHLPDYVTYDRDIKNDIYWPLPLMWLKRYRDKFVFWNIVKKISPF